VLSVLEHNVTLQGMTKYKDYDFVSAFKKNAKQLEMQI
jgi:hypothetical protein